MVSSLPHTMQGVQLTGHGGLDTLVYRQDLALPTLGAGEVLIQVAAAAINNTDINTRIGWYSKSISGQTNDGGQQGFDQLDDEDASWSGEPLHFPRIQGADCCGHIVAVGDGVDAGRIGERVLVRPMHESPMAGPSGFITFGSECDGAFAQYAKVASSEAFAVQSSLTDAELASFPCAYSTAENMVDRAGVGPGDRVLITGASGGVGSAAIQLAKRRGAVIYALSSASKAEALKALGAEKVLDRQDDPMAVLGADSVDVILDLVAGPSWGEWLNLLAPRGRYAVAGAVAGPLVELDVRTLYLKDLTFFGCTYQPRRVFENLVRYIENGEIAPLVAERFPLAEIRQAQEVFLAKGHVGKIVLIP
ncbi:alcohol dehydrogenase family protein [Ferrimonas balearica]|uniref:alcohol dehydrogenase family protein n=1 Tax=Ferrimonas balearica TaxID=44012 RepID=UPI001C99D921|nr:alcohol dehydrogenase family protein [Ferrimonas balearica]MBY5991218.1 alcohol dehydrogenase family protein [Ferrimonas balearica]